MAQKTTVTLVDDLTGEEAEDITTVEFGQDGVTYEIDLTDKNATTLRDSLAEFVAAARRTGGRRNQGRPVRRTTPSAAVRSVAHSTGAPSTNPGADYDRDTKKAIREYARKNGMEVGDRGRLPEEAVQLWENKTTGYKGPQTGDDGVTSTQPAFQPAEPAQPVSAPAAGNYGGRKLDKEGLPVLTDDERRHYLNEVGHQLDPAKGIAPKLKGEVKQAQRNGWITVDQATGEIKVSDDAAMAQS